MTTFTLQDLYTPTTEGKSNIMETTLDNPTVGTTPTQQEQLAQHELNHAIIQGATGAQYTPIDTSPQAQQNQQEMQNLFITLTSTIQAIIKLSVEKYKQPVSGGEDLRECVDTVLRNSGWMDDMVKEQCEIAVTDGDFSYEIESAVETHFSNSFCLEDHLDVVAEIESIIDDKLDDMVQEKLEELVRDKLQSATISFN